MYSNKPYEPQHAILRACFVLDWFSVHLEQTLKMGEHHIDREVQTAWAGEIQKNLCGLIFSLWSVVPWRDDEGRGLRGSVLTS